MKSAHSVYARPLQEVQPADILRLQALATTARQLRDEAFGTCRYVVTPQRRQATLTAGQQEDEKTRHYYLRYIEREIRACRGAANRLTFARPDTPPAAELHIQIIVDTMLVSQVRRQQGSRCRAVSRGRTPRKPIRIPGEQQP